MTLPMASPEAANSSSATIGLSSPAKIGVGVGVSLGVVFFAIIIAGLVLVRRTRNGRSKLEDQGQGGGAEKSATTDEPVMQELDNDGNGAGIGSGARELHAIESPPTSRELTGSPGPPRYELE